MNILTLIPIILILGAYIPLITAARRATSPVNIATFGLWIVTGVCVSAATYAAGGEIPYIGIGFVLANGVLVCALLSAHAWRWSYKETVALGVVIAGLLVWYVSEPLYALIALVAGNYLGAGMPTLIDAYRNPQRSQVLSWSLFSLAALINCVVITNITLESYIYPVAALVFNSLVALANLKK